MGTSFVLCSGCKRHVRDGDARCPFCNAEITGAPVPDYTEAASAAGIRLSRAATILLGASLMADCSMGSLYGGPPVPPPMPSATDSAVVAQPTPPAPPTPPTPPPPPPQPIAVPAYGGPVPPTPPPTPPTPPPTPSPPTHGRHSQRSDDHGAPAPAYGGVPVVNVHPPVAAYGAPAPMMPGSPKSDDKD